MEKHKNNYFWIILTSLFIIFISYLIAYNSGYYEANVNKTTKIVEEKLEEFEQDVKDGKEIDIKEYVTSDYIDYSSSFSKLGSKLSTSLDNFVNNDLTNIFNFIGKLFT